MNNNDELDNNNNGNRSEPRGRDVARGGPKEMGAAAVTRADGPSGGLSARGVQVSNGAAANWGWSEDSKRRRP